jgi:hypothetical protein
MAVDFMERPSRQSRTARKKATNNQKINIELDIITNNLPKDTKHRKGAISIKYVDIEAL